ADFQPIWPAVIFDRERPCSIRRKAEDAAKRYVDDVKIAFTIERWAFDEAVGRMARPVGIGPFGADVLAAEILGHRRKHVGLDMSWGLFQEKHLLVHLLFFLHFLLLQAQHNGDWKRRRLGRGFVRHPLSFRSARISRFRVRAYARPGMTEYSVNSR